LILINCALIHGRSASIVWYWYQSHQLELKYLLSPASLSVVIDISISSPKFIWPSFFPSLKSLSIGAIGDNLFTYLCAAINWGDGLYPILLYVT
jgi:hypothetical protein